MLKNKRLLLYCGLLTVAIEWLGLLVASFYVRNFNPNTALSVIGSEPMPLPFIFGITFTLVGITYYLFSLSLKSYSEQIPKLAFIAGIAFIVVGWIPFKGDSTTDVIHNLAAYIAMFGYIGMVWLLQAHPHKKVSEMSKNLFRLLILLIFVIISSLYFFHWYIAYLELLILFVIQCWTVFVIWFERRLKD